MNEILERTEIKEDVNDEWQSISKLSRKQLIKKQISKEKRFRNMFIWATEHDKKTRNKNITCIHTHKTISAEGISKEQMNTERQSLVYKAMISLKKKQENDRIQINNTEYDKRIKDYKHL